MAERPRSRSFGPTVLAGLAGATLASVAAARDWAHASGRASGVAVTAAAKGSESAPLALALGLVALAAWGVVLVVRTRARRVVAVVGALASAGVLAATVVAFGRAQDDASRALEARGATGDVTRAALTGWYWAALVGGVLALLAFVAALRLAPRWPAMGTRYDAPATRAAREQAAPATEQDMWRALDDGRDPTA
jgi:uncharacterized membrane protein (TIGR02234 family)